MSAVVKLSTKLPGDPATNGCDAQRDDLVDNPDELRCAVVWYDTAKVTIDTDTDEHVPTIRLRRIEPIGLVGDVDPGVRAAVEQAVEKRTGRKAIPFSIVEVDDDGAYGDPQQLGLDDVLDAVEPAGADA